MLVAWNTAGMRCNDVNLTVSTVRVKILDTGRSFIIGCDACNSTGRGGEDCLWGKCGICVKLGIFDRLIIV